MTFLYVFDASTIISRNRENPPDVFPTVWQNLGTLISSGRAFLPQVAFEELRRKTDACAAWAKQYPGFISTAADNEIVLVREMTQRYPTWVTPEQNQADPWIIAKAASILGGVIVTEERRKGPGTAEHNLKIPNVADKYGLTCINFNELARRESWQF